MRRFLAVLFIVTLLAHTAIADTTIDATANRGIKHSPVTDNIVPEGVSPTTGLNLSDYDVPDYFAGLATTGIYFPVLVQISVPYDEKSKNPTLAYGTGNKSPWGLLNADIIYELPLHANGEIRMSALFSDVIPDAVGPIRSARIGHVWLREEWDCGFMYYGQQEYKQTNVIDEVRRTGANEKGLLWPGTVGESRPWKKYYTVYKSKRLRAKLSDPNDQSGNPADFLRGYLIPQWPDILTYPQQVNHAYKFADTPNTKGDTAETVYVTWRTNKGKDVINEVYTYNAKEQTYTRKLVSKKRSKDLVTWADLETQEPITFSNVIVQWAKTTYLGLDAPVTENVGSLVKAAVVDKNTYEILEPAVYNSIEGNADIFMNGRHISGIWYREGLNTRTVFFDENGEEVELQRGRTMIIQLPYENGCSYGEALPE